MSTCAICGQGYFPGTSHFCNFDWSNPRPYSLVNYGTPPIGTITFGGPSWGDMNRALLDLERRIDEKIDAALAELLAERGAPRD